MGVMGDESKTITPAEDAAPAARIGGFPRSFVMRRRALALVVTLVALMVFSVGWLADNLGPATPTPTQGALTQQVGLNSVSLTVSASSQPLHQTEALLLRVTDTSGTPVVGARALCALSMPEMGMALPAVSATQTDQPGVYRCSAQALLPGAWALALTLDLPSGQRAHATFHFTVA